MAIEKALEAAKGQFPKELAKKGPKMHSLTTHLEFVAEDDINDYLDLEEFKDDIGVSWSHNFESSKRRFWNV